MCIRDRYSLDGELLIHRDLLNLADGRPEAYARIRLDSTTDTATRNRIDDALGTSLSALIAHGAWPNHPTDVVLALIPIASTITIINADNPSHRAIRIVLNQDAYADQIGPASEPGSEVAPIIDVHIALDGTIQRLVARIPGSDEPTALQEHNEGYAVDYSYEPTIDISPPHRATTFDLATDQLPTEPPAIPCELEP